MSRYDGPSTRRHPKNDGYRVDKNHRPKLKVKGTAKAPQDWAQKGKGQVKNAQAGITPLKRRLRSLGRLLSNNSKLPADVKIGHEREILALKHELEGLMLQKERAEMIGRYHKVRFFERQKAAKRLKKAEKNLAQFPVEEGNVVLRKPLEKKVRIAKVDVMYPQYYPYMTPYVSLYKKAKGKEGEEEHYEANDEQEDGAKGNHEVWRRVEQAMKDDTLEPLKEIVDETKLTKIRADFDLLCKISKASNKASGGATADQDEEENDTGGNFFEE